MQLRRLAAAIALALLTASSAFADTTEYGAYSALGITGTVQVSNGQGRLGCVSVVSSPSNTTIVSDVAGTAASPGATTSSTAVLELPANVSMGTVICLNWPIVNGIAVSTNGILAISYGRR